MILPRPQLSSTTITTTTTTTTYDYFYNSTRTYLLITSGRRASARKRFRFQGDVKLMNPRAHADLNVSERATNARNIMKFQIRRVPTTNSGRRNERVGRLIYGANVLLARRLLLNRIGWNRSGETKKKKEEESLVIALLRLSFQIINIF